jgi:hypothetical protein
MGLQADEMWKLSKLCKNTCSWGPTTQKLQRHCVFWLIAIDGQKVIWVLHRVKVLITVHPLCICKMSTLILSGITKHQYQTWCCA